MALAQSICTTMLEADDFKGKWKNKIQLLTIKQ
jgi:hypothetical protein